MLTQPKSWIKRSKPSEVQPVPWLAPAVTDYLASLVRPDWRVFEHGAGGSTLWFAERCAEVWSVETNLEWFDEIKRRAPKNVLMRQDITSHDLQAQGYFDLALIDGEPVIDRAGWLVTAQSLVKSGGIVVLDNTNRQEYAKEREAIRAKATHYVTFTGKEGNFIVTEFYWMP